MFSSVSGLHPLFISSNTLSPLFWQQKMSPDIAWCLRRKWKWSLWANISFPSWDPDILGQDVPVTDLILIGFMSVFLTCVKLFLFFQPEGMQDPSSLTRDWTPRPLDWKRRVLTTEPPGKPLLSSSLLLLSPSHKLESTNGSPFPSAMAKHVSVISILSTLTPSLWV